MSWPTWYFVLVAALLGLAIGSFLNVLIWRLPPMLFRQWRGDARAVLDLPTEAVDDVPGLVRPSSHCPSCRAPIRWRHNVPVLGWLVLGGRCADCGVRISWRYPLVEIVTGLLFLACAWHFGQSLAAGAAMALCAVLLVLSGIDLDERLLPDVLTLPLLWAGLLLNAGWHLFATPAAAVLGAAGGYAVLWLVAWLFERCSGRVGMGHGDFKLLAALGAWFGWQALPSLLLLSALCGLAIGLYLRWRYAEAYAPYGPGLAVAGVAVLFAGPL